MGHPAKSRHLSPHWCQRKPLPCCPAAHPCQSLPDDQFIGGLHGWKLSSGQQKGTNPGRGEGTLFAHDDHSGGVADLQLITGFHLGHLANGGLAFAGNSGKHKVRNNLLLPSCQRGLHVLSVRAYVPDSRHQLFERRVDPVHLSDICFRNLPAMGGMHGKRPSDFGTRTAAFRKPSFKMTHAVE